MSTIHVEVVEPFTYRDRSLPIASWYVEYEIQPGTYEVTPWSNLPYYNHFKADATILEEYFPSNFAGCSVQSYEDKRYQHKGDPAQVWIDFPAAYELKLDRLVRWCDHYKSCIVQYELDGKIMLVSAHNLMVTSNDQG